MQPHILQLSALSLLLAGLLTLSGCVVIPAGRHHPHFPRYGYAPEPAPAQVYVAATPALRLADYHRPPAPPAPAAWQRSGPAPRAAWEGQRQGDQGHPRARQGNQGGQPQPLHAGQDHGPYQF